MKFLYAVLAMAVSGCGCDTYAAPGLILVTRDAISGQPLTPADDVTVIAARNGAIIDSTQAGPDGTAYLLWEKTGSFEISVNAKGRKTWRKAPARLFSDGCHVETRRLTADMVRNN